MAAEPQELLADSGDVVELAGLPIARIGSEEVAERVFEGLDRESGGWILTANVDFLERVARDPDTKELYLGADLVVADGTPLLWAARLQGKPLPARVAGTEYCGFLQCLRAPAIWGRVL